MATLPEFTNSYSSTKCTSALLPAMYTIYSVSPCSTTGPKLWRNYHCLVFFRKACKLPLSLGARSAPWIERRLLFCTTPPALLHSWRPPVANRPLRPDLVHISGTRKTKFPPQAHIWFSGNRVSGKFAGNGNGTRSVSKARDDMEEKEEGLN